MRRRKFVTLLGGAVGAMTVPVELARALESGVRRNSNWILIPMDDGQSDHLRSYGVTFRHLKRQGTAEWLLNYRGGSFLSPYDPALERDAILSGVQMIRIGDGDVMQIRGEIQAGNMDAVPLEKAPEVAVYQPPDAAPWDDAVTMALEYSGIDYARVWDAEVVQGGLADYEWLHLHHEDFTGQYSKFYLTYAGSHWLAEMVQLNTRMARGLGFATVPDLKKAVAQQIRAFVDQRGFLFAMCAATETLDLALAAENVDIAAQYSDGTPMDPNASEKVNWSQSFAFDNVRLEYSSAIASFSDIDGHQVNNPPARQPLGSFRLFNFSAKIDPVPTMLVQNHRDVIEDFYGLTTSFNRARLQPDVT
ncbi:MAG: asparagine synthetase B, partial [Gemmatimonadales bacterium]